MKTYLCGHINGCNDKECKDWRNRVKRQLVDTVDPMIRDFRGVEKLSVEEIVNGDKSDIDPSDILLVNYEKPSIGTSMEILYAHERGKIVLVVAKNINILSPWLIYHSHKIFNNMEDAVKYIKTFDKHISNPNL